MDLNYAIINKIKYPFSLGRNGFYVLKVKETTPIDEEIFSKINIGEREIYRDYYKYKYDCLKAQELGKITMSEYSTKLNEKYFEEFEIHNEEYVNFINNLFQKYNIDIEVKYIG